MSEYPRFEICQGKDGKNYWHLKGANGEVVLRGRGYATKSESLMAIGSLLRYGQLESGYLRRESANGTFFFQIKSPSGRLLGWSEMHPNKQARESAIERVKEACKRCNVIDTTP